MHAFASFYTGCCVLTSNVCFQIQASYTEEKKLADEFCVYIGWLFASAVTNARVYGAGTAEETFYFQ